GRVRVILRTLTYAIGVGSRTTGDRNLPIRSIRIFFLLFLFAPRLIRPFLPLGNHRSLMQAGLQRGERRIRRQRENPWAGQPQIEREPEHPQQYSNDLWFHARISSTRLSATKRGMFTSPYGLIGARGVRTIVGDEDRRQWTGICECRRD